ncbi:General substrate transporter [Cynara cardunculus var. scolymus]|uniref:General substrate transporter n=1 Tax=Cynara cardunculus var. scolymus TaxID=59895 RepID=A0A103YBJ4_CYNCS|nr:General substrate transporter [Cynara cardunculus var. scolymus]
MFPFSETNLKETIVSMAVAGAIIGAAFGGWMNDKFGRKKSIMSADVVFLCGAIIMASAPNPWIIIVGRLFIGLGVGMASMTAPLYISEASPARIRGALVSTNGLLITGGQFLSYLINLAFTKKSCFSLRLDWCFFFGLTMSLFQAPGTWRWMLGVAGIPPIIQFVLMWFLPESPRWLYRQIYPTDEVEKEMKALQSSIEDEKQSEDATGCGMFSKLRNAWRNKVVRRGLYAGITVQVAQQFVGINTVMYYSPVIVQLAGYASNRTALALSLITAGLNSLGTIISMLFVDRCGRRRFMIVSMFGIITCLVVLAAMFFQASVHSPPVSIMESNHFGVNSTCSNFRNTPNPTSWDCMTCLKASSGCGFCANGANIVSPSISNNQYNPGACLAMDDITRGSCRAEHRSWYTKGCPSKFGIFAILLLALYIISYAPGMGTVPWIVNSEIYPLKYRGLGGGVAAVANWTSNLIVSQTFLTLTETLGTAGTFLLFAGFSVVGLVAIFFLVPETKGLQFEEVEKMLDKGYRPDLCCNTKPDA